MTEGVKESNIQHFIDSSNIEINEQFQKALDLMENTSKNVFITGRAGTGKSTLLDYFRNTSKKKVVVLAPTGVAALNIKGQTIHSFFRFKPDITVQTVEYAKNPLQYSRLDTIVIDEISMVRADLLDCIDQFLKLNTNNNYLPFGGIQMVFIGDLYQLPPVVTRHEVEAFRVMYESPFFFDAKIMNQFELQFIELQKIYRQKDDNFIALLNRIRNNTITDQDLHDLNRRHRPQFEPDLNDFYMWLTAINNEAARINEEHLQKLDTPLKYYTGVIEGDLKEKDLPTTLELEVKEGAQVMLLNNDPEHRWVNGSLGHIVEIIEHGTGAEDTIVVHLSTGGEVNVSRVTWKMYRQVYNATKDRIESQEMGAFTQYPIKLAWAVTIHKSQGKTFDRCIIDIGTRGTFVAGQMYVALSRCTTLDGIILKVPVEKRHIFVNPDVQKFVMRHMELSESEGKLRIINIADELWNAIKDHRKVMIEYKSVEGPKDISEVWPVVIGAVGTNGNRHLVMKATITGGAYESGDLRPYIVDRIIDVKEVKDNTKGET